MSRRKSSVDSPGVAHAFATSEFVYRVGSLRFSVLLLALWFCGPQAWAQSKHPIFVAEGFDFSQVDTICVMPVIDTRQDARPPLRRLESLRVTLNGTLEQRGYQTDRQCSEGTGADASHTGGSRWLLTVRVDSLTVVGGAVTGSLYDTQTDKEVWKDSAIPGYGGRFKNSMKVQYGMTDADELVRSSFHALLATFEGKKKKKQ